MSSFSSYEKDKIRFDSWRYYLLKEDKNSSKNQHALLTEKEINNNIALLCEKIFSDEPLTEQDWDFLLQEGRFADIKARVGEYLSQIPEAARGLQQKLDKAKARIPIPFRSARNLAIKVQQLAKENLTPEERALKLAQFLEKNKGSKISKIPLENMRGMNTFSKIITSYREMYAGFAPPSNKLGAVWGEVTTKVKTKLGEGEEDSEEMTPELKKLVAVQGKKLWDMLGKGFEKISNKEQVAQLATMHKETVNQITSLVNQAGDDASIYDYFVYLEKKHIESGKNDWKGLQEDILEFADLLQKISASYDDTKLQSGKVGAAWIAGKALFDIAKGGAGANLFAGSIVSLASAVGLTLSAPVAAGIVATIVAHSTAKSIFLGIASVAKDKEMAIEKAKASALADLDQDEAEINLTPDTEGLAAAAAV